VSNLLSPLCKPSDLKRTHKIRSLKNEWVSDLGRSDSLNPTASVADPTETIPVNQITPRVGLYLKQNFEFDFEIRIDLNL
jgi:hypothetical protein